MEKFYPLESPMFQSKKTKRIISCLLKGPEIWLCYKMKVILIRKC